MAEAKKSNRIWVKDVRIAYANGIFEARAAQPGGKPKFGAGFLFPVSHPAVKVISDAVISAANTGWGEKAPEMLKQLKAADRLPVHNGDAKASSAGYAGNLYMNAGNAIRPIILDADARTPLTAADGKIYSGCYVNVLVEIWPQKSKEFGTRINASLLGVQFVRDGERLAGGSAATAEDFEPIPGAETGNADGAGDPAALFN